MTGEFPAHRSVTRSFDDFFDLCLKNGRVNNGEAGDFKRHRAHYDVNGQLKSAIVSQCVTITGNIDV